MTTSVESDKYGTTQRQKALLEMMRELHPFLKEHGIKYSLSGGSVLGAIRHKGFIPWDDDIDIMVDRDNYNKITQLLTSEKNRKFELVQDIWLYRIIMKETASVPERERATVDIFVMDNCPDQKLLQRCKLMLIMILQGMLHEKPSGSGAHGFYRVCLIVTYYLGRILPYHAKFTAYERVSRIGNGKKTRYLSSYDDLFRNLKIKYPNSLMQNVEEIPFEDMCLPVVSQYDEYLTKMYGDYMTPPEEQDRIPRHM